MEEKKETTTMGYIGTTRRTLAFIPSQSKVGTWPADTSTNARMEKMRDESGSQRIF